MLAFTCHIMEQRICQFMKKLGQVPHGMHRYLVMSIRKRSSKPVVNLQTSMKIEIIFSRVFRKEKERTRKSNYEKEVQSRDTGAYQIHIPNK